MPIWHNVDADFIQKQSPYLLDIKALTSNMEWNVLIDHILEIVRPDIINSHLMLRTAEKLYRTANEAHTEQVLISQMYRGPIRHQSLPVYLVIATQLISEVFGDVLRMDYKEMVADFASDLDYKREFALWSAMASTYVAFNREIGQRNDDLKKRKEVVGTLLDFINDGKFLKVQDLKYISEKEYLFLIRLFVNNYSTMMEMMKRYG